MRSTRLARVRRQHALDERGKLRRRDRRLLRASTIARAIGRPSVPRRSGGTGRSTRRHRGSRGAQRQERRGWCQIACRADRRHGTRSHARCRPAESSTARGRRGSRRRPRSRPQAQRRRDSRSAPAQGQAAIETRAEATVDLAIAAAIGIEAEQAAVRAGRLQDPLGVPTAADRGIDLKASGAWREHPRDSSASTGRCLPSSLLHGHWSDPERTLEAHVVPHPLDPEPFEALASDWGSSSARRYVSHRLGAQISA